MAKIDLFLNTLKQAGKRVTEQRRLICEYLAQTDLHPTPYEVYADVSAAHPEISRATVYNTLNVLQELGAIVEIGFGAGHTHYDTDTSPHVNLICLRCHEIVDYHGEIPMGDLLDRVTEERGFYPVAAKVEIVGFCQACSERKKAEIRQQWLEQQGVEQQDKDNGASRVENSLLSEKP